MVDHPLFETVRSEAELRGFNLVAAVSAAEFDRCQPAGRRSRDLAPDCGTILVLGTGGCSWWDRFCADEGEPRVPSPNYHPINLWSQSQGRELLALLESQGCQGKIVQPDDKKSINFIQLAESSGLGVVSPVIGLILHPEYGPWVSMRLAILLDGEPFGSCPPSPLLEYDPCCACERPCVEACPVEAIDGFGGQRFERCGTHRHLGGCLEGCDVRRACVEGLSDSYGREEECFRHAYSLFALRRMLGLGIWKLVPEVLRRRL